MTAPVPDHAALSLEEIRERFRREREALQQRIACNNGHHDWTRTQYVYGASELEAHLALALERLDKARAVLAEASEWIGEQTDLEHGARAARNALIARIDEVLW